MYAIIVATYWSSSGHLENQLQERHPLDWSM